MIIGITGTIGAGKGTIVNYLVKRGFKHYSVRDFISEEIRNRGLEVSRDNLVKVGNDLREKFGAGYIAEQLHARAKEAGGNSVIESLRTPGEVETLRQKGDFILFAVDANIGIRYSRITNRGTSTDNITFETFVENEKRELSSTDPNKQNISECIKMADYVFENNGTIEELYEQVNKVLKKIQTFSESKIQRPSWDEYFMKLAALVAERSTCLRHNVGAVIVKGKRVLTTGYNGAARNMDCCLDLGCLRDELGIPSGTRHEICRAIHAEQNAIIQAGIHGINIDGATMYCTHTPCMICAKMIVNSGLKEVISYHDYADEEARKFLIEANVKLKKIEKPPETIRFKD
jgi:dCMP deaminase